MLIKSKKSQKLHPGKIQKQLQMKKKELEKYIKQKKKHRKLLMIINLRLIQ